MKADEFARFKRVVDSNLPTAMEEAKRIDLKRFPRVRIVIEFEAPDKAALEIRKRRPWEY